MMTLGCVKVGIITHESFILICNFGRTITKTPMLLAHALVKNMSVSHSSLMDNFLIW